MYPYFVDCESRHWVVDSCFDDCGVVVFVFFPPDSGGIGFVFLCVGLMG